jgi:hypothetical protein
MSETALRDRIDDYVSSIHAMVGFANFYLWDASTRQDRDDVIVFQGRRLRPVPPTPSPETANADDPPNPNEDSPDSEPTVASIPAITAAPLTVAEAGEIVIAPPIESDSFVTPDLGLLLPDATGVLAEIKLSFPRDETHWSDDFKQLLSYDADLSGWPSVDQKVQTHDVVLITEQGRAVAVTKYFELRKDTETIFSRPFVIISCNRSDNRQPYYFFERRSGKLSHPAVDAMLEGGTKVPMQKLLDKYSTVKLYDAQPPLPYMMDLIWTNVVIDAARASPKFPRLTKRQKLPVELSIDDIVQRLREGFTFRSLDANADDGSSSIPHRSWVVDACEQLTFSGDAEWFDATKKDVRVFFRKYEDPLAHFVAICAQMVERAESQADPQKLLNFNAR